MSNLVPALNETVINVLDYGAKGDGVADDTASINSALLVASGSKLYFPKGTYNISSLDTLPNNTHIFGDGIDETILFHN